MSTPSEPVVPPKERLDEIWAEAYRARSKEDLLRLYDRWAETYDDDHQQIGFFGHRATAEMLSRYVPFRDVARILDAGCGTGAAGDALAPLGYRSLVGLDLSQGMLDRAAEKGHYERLIQGDLGLPLDAFPCSSFDAAVLVGVFSYGQAPAHALDEIVRLVRPGGIVVFTMRVDFFEEDAMGVRSRMEALSQDHAWKQVEASEPLQYLPKKDPEALFRVYCYRVLETKTPPVDEVFAGAVRTALMSPSPVKRIDHRFIWNSMASRLYDRYTDCSGYYLTDCEVEIIGANATEILDDAEQVLELGCGSAKKICRLLGGRPEGAPPISYVPIDVSKGAVEATTREVVAEFGERVQVAPRHGDFDAVLASIPARDNKLMVFFGGSLGNFETLEETVEFLEALRGRMTGNDRIVVGIDLHKDPEVLRQAYEAGPANRSFFLNMLRRVNRELGGNLDLAAFRQESPYEEGKPYHGIHNRCVQLRLVNGREQVAYLSSLHMEAHIAEGDAIQVGTSRKFESEDIAKLARLAGLELRRQWRDERGYFSLNEFVCGG